MMLLIIFFGENPPEAKSNMTIDVLVQVEGYFIPQYVENHPGFMQHSKELSRNPWL